MCVGMGMRIDLKSDVSIWCKVIQIGHFTVNVPGAEVTGLAQPINIITCHDYLMRCFENEIIMYFLWCQVQMICNVMCTG